MEFETRIVKIERRDVERRKCRELASAEIQIPEMGVTIRRVLLTWSDKHGFGAVSPRPEFGESRVIEWRFDSPFALDLVEKLKTAYGALGGTLPGVDRTAEQGEVDRAIA